MLFITSTRRVFYSTSISGNWRKNSDDPEVPKVDKNKRATTVEAIMHHFKLIQRIQHVPLASVVKEHIKVAQIPLDVELT